MAKNSLANDETFAQRACWQLISTNTETRAKGCCMIIVCGIGFFGSAEKQYPSTSSVGSLDLSAKGRFRPYGSGELRVGKGLGVTESQVMRPERRKSYSTLPSRKPCDFPASQ